jgi:hypothetical protein
VSHFWDPSEPKLLACEIRRLRGGVSQAAADAPLPSAGSALKLAGGKENNSNNRGSNDRKEEGKEKEKDMRRSTATITDTIGGGWDKSLQRR